MLICLYCTHQALHYLITSPEGRQRLAALCLAHVTDLVLRGYKVERWHPS